MPAAWLLLSSVALYAGGVALNDVFDAALDKVERPERPIPSGVVSRRAAAVYGGTLLFLGVGLAFLAHPVSAYVALLLGLAILAYDAFSKKIAFLGPLNMGICRGLNLVLGISVLGDLSQWGYAVIPVVYIFAITMISRGEVHGNNKKHILWAAFLYLLVIFSLTYVASMYPANNLQALLFLGIFAFLVLTPLMKAYRENHPENIRKAVMAGVLSLIVMDAALSVVFTTWWYGFIILLLWPFSRMLSKFFAVT